MLYGLMVRDSNLSPETEQFSFIRTIAGHFHQDNNDDEFNRHLSVIRDSKSFDTSEVSALCETSNTTKNSFLTVNYNTTISDRWYTLDTSNNGTLSTVIVLPESELENKLAKKEFNYYLDKICLIFAGGYLCFVLWWLFGTEKGMLPLTSLLKQETISQADVEFADYVKQSLEIIDRKVEKQQSSTSEVVSPEEKTPELAYVPVYTPTPTPTSNKNTNFSQPNTLLLPPPPPNQLAAMNPPVSAIPIEPPAAPSELVRVKTTPAKTSTESHSQKEAKPEIAAATTKSKMNHTLVGVMELKEGSAALFKINGITHRIWSGEQIENTGWVLDSVANQQVKISHQGKSVTLSVGEKF